MKEVQLTIRIEPELRDQFAEVAALEHRPAAQVIRALMREYVDRARTAERAKAALSPMQMLRRRRAVDFAQGSVRLEGFKVSEAEREHAERYARGEIDLNEFVHGGKL